MIAKIETHFQGNLAAIETTGSAMPHDIGVTVMRVFLARFLQSEDGAVTVDWVVLTAAIVGLGVAVIGTVSDGALDHSSGLGAHIEAQEIATYGAN